jgi:hypothetical protein
MEPVTAQALEEKLKKETTVQVCGMAFRIKRAPLLLLADESTELWVIARESRERLVEKIKELIANPTLSRIQRVLMAGVIQPRLSLAPEEEAVCIDLILADHELSTGLFISIVNFSLEAGDSR